MALRRAHDDIDEYNIGKTAYMYYYVRYGAHSYTLARAHSMFYLHILLLVVSMTCAKL